MSANPAMSVEEILARHPKPWGESIVEGKQVGFRLNANGQLALGNLLLLHEDCVDEDAANKCKQNDDLPGFWLELAKSAEKFITQHQDHSCVPGIPTEALLILVGMYKLHCLDRAGVDWGKEAS
jgi:hypothetical protein